MTAQVPLFEKPRSLVTLWPHQVAAVARIQEELRENRSTLLVMATGTGKTCTFADLIAKTPGRSLVLAHRDELVQQAAARIETQTGKRVGVEKAELRASLLDDVVVASVQTLRGEARRTRWPADHFSLVVIDEAHHAVADTYGYVIDHFSDAKLLGVTATPDRGDGEAMGKVFDTFAYRYDIADAIRDGILCPIRCTSIYVKGLDMSAVRTTAGDLNQGDLDTLMTEEVLHGIAKPVLELAGDRRTLVFATSVVAAHKIAEIICRYKPAAARALDGSAPTEERRDTLRQYEAGSFQYLVNCALFTEGFDSPAISCVAVGRPTKSRSLYAQMIGRGTRTFPGKDNLLVLDFTGNAGRHQLMSPIDVLAGKYSDDVVARAKDVVAKEPGVDASDALARAEALVRREAEIAETAARAAERRHLKAPVAYKAVDVNPFSVLGVSDPGEEFRDMGGRPASDRQVAALGRWKIPVPMNCTTQQASKLLATAGKRADLGLCTFKQAEWLRKKGYDPSRVSFRRASEMLDAIFAGRPVPAEAPREPGSDDW